MFDLIKINQQITEGYKIAYGLEDNAIVQPVKRIRRPRKKEQK